MEVTAFYKNRDPTMIVRKRKDNDKDFKDVAVVSPRNRPVPILFDADDFYAMRRNYPDRSFHMDSKGYATMGGTSCHRTVMTSHSHMTPDDEKNTADHINQVRNDNRRDNLRWATISEQMYNRSVRNRSEYPEICDALGVEMLPRSIRWDETEKKFTCKDHPLYKIAQENGISICTSGTKSENVSLLNKFRSVLEVLLAMFSTLGEHGVDISDELKDTRVTLAQDYNDIVRFAHLQDPAHFPDGPYADIAMLKNIAQRDVMYYRSILDALPPLQEGESTGGPKSVPVSFLSNRDLDAVASFKGDEPHPFVWDAKHNSVLERLTVDKDGRIHLSEPTRNLLNLHWWPMSKIHLYDVVYHVLENNPVTPGFTVVPYNQIKRDVRYENLVYVRGEPKNYKPPTPVQIRANVDIGMPFLPRGVTIFRPDAERQPTRFEFHVRVPMSFLPENGSAPPNSREVRPIKRVAYTDNARTVFDNTVLPSLRDADPQFDAKNAKYQRLIEEYYVLARM